MIGSGPSHRPIREDSVEFGYPVKIQAINYAGVGCMGRFWLRDLQREIYRADGNIRMVHRLSEAVLLDWIGSGNDIRFTIAPPSLFPTEYSVTTDLYVPNSWLRDAKVFQNGIVTPCHLVSDQVGDLPVYDLAIGVKFSELYGESYDVVAVVYGNVSWEALCRIDRSLSRDTVRQFDRLAKKSGLSSFATNMPCEIDERIYGGVIFQTNEDIRRAVSRDMQFLFGATYRHD